MRQVGATLHRGVRASHYRGLSCCGAQAPDAQAQQLWPTGPVALRHVGSSQTRARTRVPCIGRQTLNHCATREALLFIFLKNFIYLFLAVLGFFAMHRLSVVAVSKGYSSLWCTGFSLRWLLLLWSTGSRGIGFSSCSTRALGHAGFSSCGAWA